ncbi:MAG TPA: hypothetical protein VNT00_11630 [Eoetvoesiella sp.]|uniref:hypothetical protein n=1 Tax=Eoetvoesiella sp. TaxID=1966355 RepID=UPI002CF1EC80|nr:hypothetical protein [Eoetvoesiella sp.]HWK62062.1 hypothetical protein [Eoetvoesiella sp.]
MKTNMKFPLVLKAAALAAAISLQGAAIAAPADGASATAATEQGAASAPSGHARFHHGSKHARMPMHHEKAALWVPGYGPLSAAGVKVLNLTESQSKLLSEAQEAQKDARKAQFEAMRAERKARFEQLKAGKIDPHAAAKQFEDAHGKSAEARKQVQAKWFAVWDSLDATQKQKVATLLGERAAKWGDHMKHRKGMPAPHDGQPMRPAPDDMPA